MWRRVSLSEYQQAPRSAIAKLSPHFVLWSVGTLCLLALASRNGLAELMRRWVEDEAYSHGFLMPAIIAFFIYRDRASIARTSFDPSWTAVLLVGASLMLFAVAETSKTYSIVHYCFIVILCGLVWATMGRASRYVLVPVSLLLFAIPLPVFTQATLTADLQLLSSKLGTALIDALGVPVYVDGNIIDLGVYRLHVAEACAGLNYLFPLLGIGHICAYLFRAAAWKRIALVLSTIPLTVLMNVGRIAGVGLLIREFGPGAAEGFIHYFQGWLVFLITIAFLLGEMALLNKIGGARMSLRQMFDLSDENGACDAKADVQSTTESTVRYRYAPKQLIACCLLIALATAFTFVQEQRSDVTPARVDFALFPAFLGDWVGSSARLESIVERSLGADDYLVSTYENRLVPEPVELFAAYYSAQRRGKRPHSPRVCLPGGGWEIERIERAQTSIDNMSLQHNRVIMRRGNDRLLAYYWYEQRGRAFANEYYMRWDLFVGGLWHDRRDGAMLRVLTPIGIGETVADAETRLNEFLGEALTELVRFLPD